MSGATVDDIDKLTTRLALTGVGWDKPRWDRFINELTPKEQALEVQMMADAAVPPSKDAWAEVFTILTAVLTVAGAVSGVAGAIQAIEGVIKNA